MKYSRKNVHNCIIITPILSIKLPHICIGLWCREIHVIKHKDMNDANIKIFYALNFQQTNWVNLFIGSFWFFAKVAILRVHSTETLVFCFLYFQSTVIILLLLQVQMAHIRLIEYMTNIQWHIIIIFYGKINMVCPLIFRAKLPVAMQEEYKRYLYHFNTSICTLNFISVQYRLNIIMLWEILRNIFQHY